MSARDSHDIGEMTIAELFQAFERAGAAKQQYEMAVIRLRQAQTAGRRRRARRIECEVVALARHAAELEAAAERTLPAALLH